MDLNGKVALVTGGAVRLGREIALALAEAGADIIFSYHTSSQAARETIADIEAIGRRVVAVQIDARSATDCQALVERAIFMHGRLDVLVNNASSWQRTPLPDLNPAAWDDVFQVSLRSAAFITQAAAPHLAEHGDGAIVNIIDQSAVTPFPAFVAHSAAKAGLLSLTKSTAITLAPRVRVNAIAPGFILPTPGTTQAERRLAADRTLLNRWGNPSDVTEAVLFLVRASYITGAVLDIDGGEHLARA